MKNKEKIYPIFYKGRSWKEDEVNDIFSCFYHCEESLNSEMSVYVADGMWISPDGEWSEY